MERKNSRVGGEAGVDVGVITASRGNPLRAGAGVLRTHPRLFYGRSWRGSPEHPTLRSPSCASHIPQDEISDLGHVKGIDKSGLLSQPHLPLHLSV